MYIMVSVITQKAFSVLARYQDDIITLDVVASHVSLGIPVSLMTESI